MLVVMQDNVFSCCCEIRLCWFLSFSLGKSGLLQLSVVPKGWYCSWHLSLSEPFCPVPWLNTAVAELAEETVCQFTAQAR